MGRHKIEYRGLTRLWDGVLIVRDVECRILISRQIIRTQICWDYLVVRRLGQPEYSWHSWLGWWLLWSSAASLISGDSAGCWSECLDHTGDTAMTVIAPGWQWGSLVQISPDHEAPGENGVDDDRLESSWDIGNICIFLKVSNLTWTAKRETVLCLAVKFSVTRILLIDGHFIILESSYSSFPSLESH